MYDRELQVAGDLARRAGEILLRVYATDFDVEFKGASDPVTEADKLANQFIVERLREEFPGDGIVAEETEDQTDALHKRRCWYVDPLDGTKEFIAKNGEFAVMIGLSVEGVSEVGAVYQPVNDKLYLGNVSRGARLEQNGRATPLRVSGIADPSELALVVSRSHRSAVIDEMKSRLGIHKEERCGSVGLKVGLIAETRADLYVLAASASSAWDACAPDAILRAAGGRFTDLGGADFRYGGEDMKNRRGILACNANAFSEVLPVVQEVAKAATLIRSA